MSRSEQLGRRKRLLVVCLTGLGILVVVAIAADWIAPHDPLAIDPSIRLAPPGPEHLLGTDHLGRDVFSRIIVGTRTALIAALEAVSIALVAGVTLGLLTGYRGGWLDRAGTRIADIMQAMPALLLALAFIAVIGDGLVNAMLAVGIIFVDSYFRLTRALVLGQREMLYVDAAHVAGLKTRTVFRNILPNIAGPLIVHTSILLGVALLIEAALSFLGVGATPDQVSWGTMLEEARLNLYTTPFLAIVPGFAITLAVLLFNLTGEALGDFLNSSDDIRTNRSHSDATATRRVSDQSVDVSPNGSISPDLSPERASDLVLEVKGLTLETRDTAGESYELLSDVEFGIRRGEFYGLVGESGSGKSMTAKAIMGLLPPGVRRTNGSIRLGEDELTKMSGGEMRRVRGTRVSMIFQEAIPSLSPVHTIGDQLVDSVRAHTEMPRNEAWERAAELLGLVGVPSARDRLKDYPHQFSGGMAQRVGVARALTGDPELLIADEPTTALDVTIQAQVLDLLVELTEKLNMAVLLITHDIGVVANTCDRVALMYAGQVMEQGPVRHTFENPRHPYAEALLAAIPNAESPDERLATIPGVVPPAWDWPVGCRFSPRCQYANDACYETSVEMHEGVRCLRVADLDLEGVE